jgi:predicted acyl esterase
MGEVWMESLRYTEQWPAVEDMFDQIDFDSLPKLDGTEKDAVERLLPFVPDKRMPVINFEGDRISTMEGAMEAEIETHCGVGSFHATPLLEVLKVATHLNVDAHPRSPFKGPSVQGIIAGVTTR